jgi:hypothetical protein
MTTLALEDLDPGARRSLGLTAACAACRTSPGRGATIPIVLIGGERGPGAKRPAPGEAWLRTGLHLLRVPAATGHARPRPTGSRARRSGHAPVTGRSRAKPPTR